MLKINPEQATTEQRKAAFARAGLCRAIERMAAQGGMTVTAACQHLADMLHSGKAEPVLVQMAVEANEKPRAGHVVAARTLLNWHKNYTVYGQNGLIPGKKSKDMRVPAWAGAFLKCYQIPTKPSVNDAYRQFKNEVKDAPSVHQVRRFLNKLSPEAREQGRMGARELKTIQPFRRRTFDNLSPNDVWTADGHTFDAEISHPFYPNRVFRPEITTYADIRTRRIVGWSVNLAESSVAVLDGLRVGIKNEGVPAVLYVDNGSGYTNAQVNAVLERIGITITHSLPYNSQAKGVVERLNQVWVRLAKRLPSYIGADMDKEAGSKIHKITRKALKEGVAHRAIIGWDAFLSMAQANVDEYNSMQHRTLQCSPDESLQAFINQGWVPETVDSEMLDVLLMPSMSRTTHRGEVRLHNRLYFDNALRDHHGDKVEVRFDMRDASRVWVHAQDGSLICEARKDGNASPYQQESFMAEALHKRDSVAADRQLQREKAQVGRGIDKIERISGVKVRSIEIEHAPGNVLEGLFTVQPVPVEISAEEQAQNQERSARLLAKMGLDADGKPLVDDTPATARPVINGPFDLYLISLSNPESLSQAQWDYLAESKRKSQGLMMRIRLHEEKLAEQQGSANEDAPGWSRAQ